MMSLPYTKMVLILSNVVNVKIKDILSNTRVIMKSHFRIDSWSALALQSPSSLSWSNVSIKLKNEH